MSIIRKIEICEFSKNFPGGFIISVRGIRFGFEIADLEEFAVGGDECNPFLSVFIPRNTLIF